MLKLFCDGSVNPQSKIGFASYLIVIDESYEIKNLQQNIKIKKFENTSSTKLELEALIWALSDEIIQDKKVSIYTDCQNILSLENRREKLENSNYKSSSGKDIKNRDLYKEFFELKDKKNCIFIKVKGHKKTSLKDEIDKLFNLVDKASRKALRDYLKA